MAPGTGAEPYPDLDTSQAAAVRRALACDGSFFIHGPPGTGKTRVIARLVREFVARDERVLVLSTTHVAVDEVLGRVGDLPGVHAVRVTWDTSKVHEDAKRFTHERVRDTRVRKMADACVEARSLFQREEERLDEASGPTADERRHRLQVLRGLTDAWEATVQDADKRSALIEEIGADLLANSNVVFATTVGIASRTFVDLGDFDLVIFDEASRMTLAEFLIGSTRARRWILVGDEHQLPPYVDPGIAPLFGALAACAAFERKETLTLEEGVGRALGSQAEPRAARLLAQDIAGIAHELNDSRAWERVYRDAYAQFEHALERRRVDDVETADGFARRVLGESVFETSVARCSESRRARLMTQRRMIEPIAEFVSKPIYDGHYLTASAAELRAEGVVPFVVDEFGEPIVFLDTSAYGNKSRDRRVGTGCVNDLEAAWVVGACQLIDEQLVREKTPARAVTAAILSFYKDQAELLSVRLRALRLRALRIKLVDSVERVQAQEADIVLLSFCRSRPGRGPLSPEFGTWLQDLRRLNVALTRARRGLFLVGHASTLRRLGGPERTKAFYAHLFARFDSHAPGTRMVSDFRAPRRR